MTYIPQSQFEFPAPVVQQAYFKESTVGKIRNSEPTFTDVSSRQTMLVRLADHTIWQSSNEGYTWTQPLPGVRFLAFYHHSYTADRAYLITNTEILLHHGHRPVVVSPDSPRCRTPSEPRSSASTRHAQFRRICACRPLQMQREVIHSWIILYIALSDYNLNRIIIITIYATDCLVWLAVIPPCCTYWTIYCAGAVRIKALHIRYIGPALPERPSPCQ